MSHTAPESPAAVSALPPATHLAYAAALHRLGGDVELLHLLFTSFASDAPARLEHLAVAMQGRDAAQVQRQAHALKGAAAIIGAQHCAQLAAVLERLAGASGFDIEDAAGFAALDAAWAALHAEARLLLSNLARMAESEKNKGD